MCYLSAPFSFQNSSRQEEACLEQPLNIPRQAGLVLVLPTSSVLWGFNFGGNSSFWALLIRARRLPTTAVLHSSTQVALTQACELVYCSCAVRLHYKCTINMGQPCGGRLSCMLWQAQGGKKQEGGKKGIRVIFLVLKQRKAVWWKTNSHVHHLYSWYMFNIGIYFHGDNECHLLPMCNDRTICRCWPVTPMNRRFHYFLVTR